MTKCEKESGNGYAKPFQGRPGGRRHVPRHRHHQRGRRARDRATGAGFHGDRQQRQDRQASDHRGKVVVLEWTNNKCPYVRKRYGSSSMQTLQKDATAQGVVWLGVISSAKGEQGYVEPAAANQMTASRSASPFAVLLDPTGKIGQEYGAKTTPHMYIVDPAGKLVHVGGIDDKATNNPADIPNSKNYVRAALGEVMVGKPASEPVTRAHGRTIKYQS
ncbi:MAG: redoxin domain-containing protein [Alphaproteobacteria bacterium]